VELWSVAHKVLASAEIERSDLLAGCGDSRLVGRMRRKECFDRRRLLSARVEKLLKERWQAFGIHDGREGNRNRGGSPKDEHASVH